MIWLKTDILVGRSDRVYKYEKDLRRNKETPKGYLTSVGILFSCLFILLILKFHRLVKDILFV